jgi:hypothetical protein
MSTRMATRSTSSLNTCLCSVFTIITVSGTSHRGSARRREAARPQLCRFRVHVTNAKAWSWLEHPATCQTPSGYISCPSNAPGV